jgi:hypothetical protein
MKILNRDLFVRWLAALSMWAATTSGFAQGTAFTYQGELLQGGSPATGTYDFTFALFTAATGGAQAGSTLTQAGVGVTNGEFTVLMDFGSVFNGTSYWLQIGMRTNGGSSFTNLIPRQQLTPTPYAVTAENLDGFLPASQLSGTLSSSALAGLYGNALTLNNSGNSFSGNGAGLFNVNADHLCGLSCSSFWLLNGNGGTQPGLNFLGTTDNQALELHVNSSRALRLEPASGNPNVIGGSSLNSVASGVGAAFIGGGDTNTIASSYCAIGGGYQNAIQNAAMYSFIGGGYQNTVQTLAQYSTIGGGEFNSIANSGGASTIGGGNGNSILSGAFESVIGGGQANSIQNNSTWSTLGGGLGNIVQGNSSFSVIGGGEFNTIQSFSHHATISGGTNNTIQTAASGATIAGGFNNNIQGNALVGTIGGGTNNTIQTNNVSATIGGGEFNTIQGGSYPGAGEASTIAGGGYNFIQGGNAGAAIGGGSGNSIQTNGSYSVISGGTGNLIGPNSSSSVIGGGQLNEILTNVTQSFIGGGYYNRIQTYGGASVLVGGNENTIQYGHQDCFVGGGAFNAIQTSCTGATIGGGGNNTILALSSSATIPGGSSNSATNYAFAAGYNAHAINSGAFVWSDGTGTPTFSPADNSVTFRASGGYWLYSSTVNAGVRLAAGSGSWTSLSDRNAKEHFAPVSRRDVLDKVISLPVTAWNYKSQDAAIRHIGPTAQDFKAAFQVGESDTGISTVDSEGVALAAIQGLNQKLEEQLKQKDARIEDLSQRLEKLEGVLKSQATSR